MTIAATLRGRKVVPAPSTDSDTIGGMFTLGAQRRAAPTHVARKVDQLANGRTTSLSTDDREHMALLGIELRPVKRDLEPMARKLQAEGLPTTAINELMQIESAKPPEFASIEPIGAVQFYKPAQY